MEKNEFEMAANLAVKGTKQAVETVNGMMKVPKDKDVRVYERLDPKDFEVIRREFGDEATMDYIRRMEIRLQKS